MSDTMNIEDYLAQGGVLTAPENVPARYRGELLRLMASFVDSELAASAGFAGAINFAPGIKARIAASRITLEKADHAGRVLAVMGEFGTDTSRYETSHDWAARVSREADLGASRLGGDMRLSVLHYPITGWADAVVLNTLQGLATGVQMTELTRVSYGPLAEVFREIAPREARHAELGLEGLERLAATEAGREAAQASLAYWQPRVAAGFGSLASNRYDMLARFGLRRTPNETLLARWQALVTERLAAIGL
ncbi:Phenylacetic acid catabolic protein [Paracoccus sp. MBLB3053]|uniref:Phenylacetic acid catabolic protein n=1 Tax=Paracoccus aurantius TaxID=3073814 RepID=A0ABU2HW45_9RHOB|nr:Phenylacetic acid catabolic protein [Paracoccus sp. MBLB3053]MDS9469273.1 Phenylacetic acid catabolic protein [Paracoccus sp. MBLB3053]